MASQDLITPVEQRDITDVVSDDSNGSNIWHRCVCGEWIPMERQLCRIDCMFAQQIVDEAYESYTYTPYRPYAPYTPPASPTLDLRGGADLLRVKSITPVTSVPPVPPQVPPPDSHTMESTQSMSQPAEVGAGTYLQSTNSIPPAQVPPSLVTAPLDTAVPSPPSPRSRYRVELAGLQVEVEHAMANLTRIARRIEVLRAMEPSGAV
jgi:hypothetical protein